MRRNSGTERSPSKSRPSSALTCRRTKMSGTHRDLPPRSPAPVRAKVVAEKIKISASVTRESISIGRNYLLSLGGETLQSGFHFVLNLGLIWALPAYEYGVFAIVFILGGISLTYGNALV